MLRRLLSLCVHCTARSVYLLASYVFDIVHTKPRVFHRASRRLEAVRKSDAGSKSALSNSLCDKRE